MWSKRFSVAFAVPEAELPGQSARGPRWERDPEFEPKVVKLKAVRDVVADRLQLDPGVLCAHVSGFEAVVRKRPTTVEEMLEIPELRRWQAEVLGAEFLRGAARVGRSTGMDDIRWFTETAFGGLVVPRLRALGLSIAEQGDAPARMVVAIGNTVAVAAWRFAAKHRCAVAQFIWDLPPWRLGGGRYDPVWSVRGRLVSMPRLGRRYVERAGLYSRLRYVAVHARTLWLPSEAFNGSRCGGAVWDPWGVAPLLLRLGPFYAGVYAATMLRGTIPTLLSVSRLVPI